MKDFDSFYSSLTESIAKEWSKEINSKKRQVILPITEGTIDDFISFTVNVNTKVTLKILQRYHHWISENE